MGKKRHIFIGTVFILLSLLPGCGTKEREMITDYSVTSIVVNLRTLSYDQKTLHVHNVVEADGDNESSLVSGLFDGT